MSSLWRLRAVISAIKRRLRQNGSWLYKLSQVYSDVVGFSE